MVATAPLGRSHGHHWAILVTVTGQVSRPPLGSSYWPLTITDEDLISAPTWAEMASSVAWLLRDRPVLAYNAPFDQGVITREMDRVGQPWPRSQWWCLMRARADVEGLPWRALEGGHRALGDCHAALEVLQALSWRPRRRVNAFNRS